MFFTNQSQDLQWLLSTHLKGFVVPPFQSFVLQGNEDAPDSVHLYTSANPLVTDDYMHVSFDKEVPWFSVVKGMSA